MRIVIFFFVHLLLLNFNNRLLAENLYLDSPGNTGTLRFEIDNDTIWNKDNNFTNGWSLQYHTVRSANWEESKNSGFIKWVGENFPTLDNDGFIVRNCHGIGQNMITPGDLNAETHQEGDLPYAGTLTYTLNWQSFNRKMARNLQVSVGLLGQVSFAEQFQKFVHNDLGKGDDPQGWDNQRDTEPIINVGYEHPWRLAYLGNYTNDWAGQISLIPSVSFGNLFTAAEAGLALRFGWNMLEGFNTYPAPPGRGFFQASHLPKPSSASPHSFEIVLGARGCALGYSVIYDGSIITDDDRNVDRNTFIFARGIGAFYHYYKLFSIRFTFQKSTDFLDEDSIPDPESGEDKTNADVSYGSLIIDLYF
ncbi:MAG: lipid A deacylase LpxR family protein [Desulfobacterales bacterium]|nr:lipid A deacylase LpxR family protein [Desulfobacterales bacterium]